LLGGNLVEVPRSDGVFDRLQQSVLPDALHPAKHQRVIDLDLWILHALRQPGDNVIGVAGVDLAHVIHPHPRLIGVTERDTRRAIDVEARGLRLVDPATVDH